jgi:competence protein ComEA
VKTFYWCSILSGLAILCLNFVACTASPSQIIITSYNQDYSGQVYISGGVNAPGLYPYRMTDTLDDLIQAAGGLQPGADIGQVKLAVSTASSTGSPQKIDLNRAETWLLEALPGIGEVTASAIVDYRQQHGPYRSLSDLLKVKDIGQATLDKIKNYVIVAEEIQ